MKKITVSLATLALALAIGAPVFAATGAHAQSQNTPATSTAKTKKASTKSTKTPKSSKKHAAKAPAAAPQSK